MRNDFFWIDAFSAQPFEGNPAAVCLVDEWPTDDWLQRFAAEMRLSETAFIKPIASDYEIRWFTPTRELGLVGHATLAAGYAVMRVIEPARQEVRFFSRREGPLTTWLENDAIGLQLPADTDLQPVACPTALSEGLGIQPSEVLRGRHYLAVLSSEAEVASLRPRFEALVTLDRPTIAVTAPGGESDYVLRFFAPANGVPEDPASGVAQCSLMPYWSSRFGKHTLGSRQLAGRDARMQCSLDAGRVSILGRCQLLIAGQLKLL